MPVYRLIDEIVFPDPRRAEDGLVAVGGDLRPERLLAAYRLGIFPWYNEGQPILWHSPDPRFVLLPEDLHVPRSLAKVIRRGDYEVRFDTAFEQVLASCARKWRPGQRGTWITRDMHAAYVKLHELGFAHSAESWLGDKLVGGLYGVSIGDVYFGESMFADAPDASKVAFVTLMGWLRERGIQLIDSQVHTDHVERFGGVEWPRTRYLARLAELVIHPSRIGRWTLSPPERADEPPS